jgi:hypothetical protein
MTAIVSWAMPSSRISRPLPDSRRTNTAAPIAIPIRKIARMSVNTYVVLPDPDDSRRVHSTW